MEKKKRGGGFGGGWWWGWATKRDNYNSATVQQDGGTTQGSLGPKRGHIVVKNRCAPLIRDMVKQRAWARVCTQRYACIRFPPATKL